MSQHKRESNRLLGYPEDARLLIVNADDFGMCHAITEGILRSLKEGIVCSTSLMVPCPWALYAMDLLKENPQIDFAIHLTVLCDTDIYRWRPLTARDKVPSLVDDMGFFYINARMEEFLARAKVDELEVEFRAQIEAVLAAGLKPTHLDWHCIHNGGRADIFEMTLRLAKEYRLVLRADEAVSSKLQSQGLPTSDYALLDSYSLNTANKSAQYIQMLRDLPAGLSEWAVHPGLDTPEFRVLEPDAPVRQTDFEFVMSSEARTIIEQEGIVLLGYAPLLAVWQQHSGNNC